MYKVYAGDTLIYEGSSHYLARIKYDAHVEASRIGRCEKILLKDEDEIIAGFLPTYGEDGAYSGALVSDCNVILPIVIS